MQRSSPAGRSRLGSTTRLAAATAAALALCALPPAAAAARPRPVGVVLPLGGLSGPPLQREAVAVGGAEWRTETIAARAPAPAPAVDQEVQELRQAYLEADFLRCLTIVQHPTLSVDRMLQARPRDAAQVAVLGAACAQAAGDLALARLLLGRVLSRELDLGSALRITRPDFQALAESVRAEVLGAPRLRVVLRARPRDARLSIDGGAHRCETTPCVLLLLPGEHLIVAERAGHAPRITRIEVERPSELTLSLEVADPLTARSQLERALATDADPGTAGVAQLTALAFGAQIVVLGWHRSGQAHALVFDRRRQTVGRVSVRGGQDNVAGAVRLALLDWRGAEPRPFYARPAFYLPVAGAVAVATGLALYFALRPQTTRHDLVFP